MAETGYEIASRVDPNTSDDVCTFCKHANKIEPFNVECALGFIGYFRSISQYGPIFVSNCGRGELRPEFLAVDTAKGWDQ